MNETNKRLPVLSILLYIVAVILVVYTIWAFVCCHAYISKLIAGNQLATSGNEFSIISYYMTNCIQDILYAVAFFFFGRLYSYIVHNTQVNQEKRPVDEKDQSSATSDLDKQHETSALNNFTGWKSL